VGTRITHDVVACQIFPGGNQKRNAGSRANAVHSVASKESSTSRM